MGGVFRSEALKRQEVKQKRSVRKLMCFGGIKARKPIIVVTKNQIRSLKIGIYMMCHFMQGQLNQTTRKLLSFIHSQSLNCRLLWFYLLGFWDISWWDICFNPDTTQLNAILCVFLGFHRLWVFGLPWIIRTLILQKHVAAVFQMYSLDALNATVTFSFTWQQRSQQWVETL